jgi:hypothetical protein
MTTYIYHVYKQETSDSHGNTYKQETSDSHGNTWMNASFCVHR